MKHDSIPVHIKIHDLRHIGTETHQDSLGRTVFVTSKHVAGLEYFMLRNIVEYLGYQIIECCDNPHGDDINITTSMPFEKYLKL